MVTESNCGESQTGPNPPAETLRGVRIFSVEIHPVRCRSPWKVKTLYWALAAKTHGPNRQPATRKVRSIAKPVYTRTVDVRAGTSCSANASPILAVELVSIAHGVGFLRYRNARSIRSRHPAGVGPWTRRGSVHLS